MEFPLTLGAAKCSLKGFIATDTARIKGLGDPNHFLINDPSSTDILMANLAISHHSDRHSDIESTGCELRPRPIFRQIVRNVRWGTFNCIKGILVRVVVGSPTVTNNQKYRAFSLFHILANILGLNAAPSRDRESQRIGK